MQNVQELRAFIEQLDITTAVKITFEFEDAGSHTEVDVDQLVAYLQEQFGLDDTQMISAEAALEDALDEAISQAYLCVKDQLDSFMQRVEE